MNIGEKMKEEIDFCKIFFDLLYLKNYLEFFKVDTNV